MSQNRFSDFSQRELEILDLALSRLPETDFLPQHADRMEATREALFQEVRSNMRATSYSRDGSHFGETYADESAPGIPLKR